MGKGKEGGESGGLCMHYRDISKGGARHLDTDGAVPFRNGLGHAEVVVTYLIA